MVAGDDYGAKEPTAYASARVEVIMGQVPDTLKELAGKAVIGTSYEGGIRAQWIYPEADVRLVIPPAEGGQEYVYYEQGDTYGLEKTDRFVARLAWLKEILEGVK